MKFASTRGGSPAVSISEAIRRGAAPDGGLYVPADEVKFDPAGLDEREGLAPLGAALLAPFFEGDPLLDALPSLCAEAFDFPAPLVVPNACLLYTSPSPRDS